MVIANGRVRHDAPAVRYVRRRLIRSARTTAALRFYQARGFSVFAITATRRCLTGAQPSQRRLLLAADLLRLNASRTDRL